MVTGNTYRHPAVLAKIAATLDQISHGRLEFGIGKPRIVLGDDEVEVHAAIADMAEIADRHVFEMLRHLRLHMVEEGQDVTPAEG